MDEALAWYDDERANLVAATRQAAAAGLHEIAWRLPPTLFPVVQPAEQLGGLRDHAPRGGGERARGRRQARRGLGLNQLGFALARLRDPEAFGHLEQALAIRQELGDTLGRGADRHRARRGHLNIDGPGEDALRYLRRAADLLEPMGAISLRSVALNNLGEVYFALGDLDAAAECYVQARDICREIGGHAEGHALHNLGRVYLRLHRLDEAIASFTEALSKHRAAGLLAARRGRSRISPQARARPATWPRRASSLAAALGYSSRSVIAPARRRLPRCSSRLPPS